LHCSTSPPTISVVALTSTSMHLEHLHPRPALARQAEAGQPRHDATCDEAVPEGTPTRAHTPSPSIACPLSLSSVPSSSPHSPFLSVSGSLALPWEHVAPSTAFKASQHLRDGQQPTSKGVATAHITARSPFVVPEGSRRCGGYCAARQKLATNPCPTRGLTHPRTRRPSRRCPVCATPEPTTFRCRRTSYVKT
jgi:hypothetical protein